MTTKKVNLENIRDHFPSFNRKIKGQGMTFFDGPGGTQVPKQVINAISNYYRYYNTNSHGQFQTSIETDKIIDGVRKDIATFLGAEGPSRISIGQNMTTLNFALSRAFSKSMKPGDEVLITQLDHEANRGPWLMLREFGIKVREVGIKQNGVLDYEDLKSKINENTRLLAIGLASNAFGTVNDIGLARKLTYEIGADLLVDAVHYAPHFPIDVQMLGVDYLLCSSYKFYGPHLGFLYAKTGNLDQLQVENLCTQEQYAPYKIETGTLNHAALAGASAAIRFISSLGEGADLREQVVSGMNEINQYEQKLALELNKKLRAIKNIKMIGPNFGQGERTPTLSFVHNELSPAEVCYKLGKHGIAAWDGHFYAKKAMEILGLEKRGGVTRIGISMYNNSSDIDKLIKVLKSL
jgi:cysteine desulfurase family protein (TIGR01976 family)